jgi:aldose sugar dehydrogenase
MALLRMPRRPTLTALTALTALPVLLATLVAASLSGQQQTVTPAAARNSPPLPPLPQVFETSVQKVRVSVVASGLVNPWSLAFLPTGEMLVTERAGRLRIVRNGVLDPKPIAGVPAIQAAVLGGLLEVALHPRFAENRFVYLTYSKAREDKRSTTALARGRWDGAALADVREIFVANTWSTSGTNYGGRVAFDRAGFLYLTVGERQEPERAQKPDEHAGKVLRLRDDGTAAPDNPFAGRAGYLPEIYSLGHRSPQGLALNPETGEIWENEHGPLGGDEVNIIRPGRNYGWPLVTFGTDYDGTKISEATARPDLEAPFMYWVPSIAISGLAFYTGDRFPAWKGSAFVGSMFAGRTRGTGHLQRITFNQGRPIQREPMLTELHQRIREVRQGPDGLLYLLTDEPSGALLKVEPADTLSSRASMGHVHYYVRDVAASRAFWLALGGTPAAAAFDGAQRIVFPDVEVHLSTGTTPGGSEGSVVNHVAFRVPSFAGVEAAGLKVARLQQFPGVGSVMSPDGERIELFEDAATNLTFTPDAGPATGIALRHVQPVGKPIAFHHIHLYLPDAAAVGSAKAWYAKWFGGVPGKRAQYDAVDLPGVNLNFSVGPKAVVPTRGRTLDHLAFEMPGLQAACVQWAREGVVFERPCTQRQGRLSTTIVDPWGTSIELTEPAKGSTLGPD